MAERKPNDVKIFAYMMLAKKLIKFANDETLYPISDNVLSKSNFEKYPLSKGDKIEVALTEGVVTYLRKQKSDAPKQDAPASEETYEPTPEEAVDTRLDKPTPTPKAESKSSDYETALTVFAVAANKKVVKFTELKDAGWFQISEAIQAQDYATVGLTAKSKVKVQLSDNNVISVSKVATEAPETSQNKPVDTKAPQSTTSATTQETKKPWTPYNASEATERQASIEAQSSINAACDVVGRVAASISPAPTANIINSMIKSVAEANHQLLQELKKRKY